MNRMLSPGTVASGSVVDDPRWPRIVARDRTADGQFWFSVATTGVYCRPSCASRTANPRNVAIHDTLAQARKTGFRPCLRCRPEEPSAQDATAALVARLCRMIEQSEQPPSLAALAAAAALSPAHLHRLFKAATGVTPKAYADARRGKRLRDRLADGATVTAASYEAGFASSGRFYASATALLGMSPRRFRDGGHGERIRFAIGACTLGSVLVASSDKGVAAILLGDDPDTLTHGLRERFPQAELVGADADYAAVVTQVIALVDTGRDTDLPLDIRGTAFQRRVWDALRQIPPGHTESYAEVARRIGAPQAVRAVAGACAANALAVAIPCHRVVRSDGGLSGYAWGPARKRALIAREANAVSVSGEPPGSDARARPGSAPLRP